MEHFVWNLKLQPELWGKENIFDSLVAEFLLSNGRSVASEELVIKKYKVKTLEELAAKQKEKLEEVPHIKKIIL